MKKFYIKQFLILIIISSFWLNFPQLFVVYAQNPLNLKETKKSNQCPQDIQSLGNLLVKDIPSYANRVIQKSRNSSRSTQSMPIYIIVASNAEFEPLPLNQTQYQGSNNEGIKQIFFTTLERHYLSKDKVIETQNYHHLLLTYTTHGWHLVMAFSRFGSFNNKNIPSPPQDTTKGIMGQAVNLWLRDCRA